MSSQTLSPKHAHLGKRVHPPVYACACRISDVAQLLSVKRGAFRGTETRYLAVVGASESTWGVNVRASD